MIWLSGISHRITPGFFRRTDQPDVSATFHSKKQKPQAIGILAFEAAKAMSRLVSLYKSLFDDEFSKLTSYVMRSEGVRYLNSVDASSVFRLAYTEKMEDLDRLALVVARLGKQCQQPGLQGFEYVYDDMKLGFVDFPKLGFPPNKLGRKIAKMEKLISATAELYSALELLTEMEVSQRKLESWKSFSGPIAEQNPDVKLFEQKLSSQRSHVRRMRETSLWTDSFDKVVGLMVRVVCNVFVRICVVFGPHVSGLPRLADDGNFLLMKSHHLQATPRLFPFPFYASGPLARRSAGAEADVIPVRNSGPILSSKPPRSEVKRDLAFYLGFGFSYEEETGSTRTAGRAGRPGGAETAGTTVGAAALAMRYANVIVMAEKMLTSREPIDDESREELYQMLPANLRTVVWEKMKRGGCRSGKMGGSDEMLAEGWREGLERIVGWLAPVAQDTIRWQMERNMERQEFGVGPTVLRLQTLYYADREKTEAAIAEVLVGLSCICHYEHRRGEQRVDKRS